MGWHGNRVGLGNRKRLGEGEKYKLACWFGVLFMCTVRVQQCGACSCSCALHTQIAASI